MSALARATVFLGQALPLDARLGRVGLDADVEDEGAADVDLAGHGLDRLQERLGVGEVVKRIPVRKVWRTRQ